MEEACAAAEPAHGEAWQAVAKAPENRRLTKVQVLRRVAAAMAGAAGAARAGGGEGE